MMANSHAFHASVTCFVKRGIEGSVWLATVRHPHHPWTPEHDTFQAAQNSSISALFQRAFFQPCRFIGVVLSPLPTWELPSAVLRPHALRRDSRTEPMGPRVADLDMLTVSGYFSARSFLAAERASFLCIRKISWQMTDRQIIWPQRSSTENPNHICTHTHTYPLCSHC